MKVYISVDFEGVAGSTSWSSTNLGDLEHGPMAREMTLEAAAACRGALAAGATEIYIKDAHESGRNMDISLLPREAKSYWAGSTPRIPWSAVWTGALTPLCSWDTTLLPVPTAAPWPTP